MERLIKVLIILGVLFYLSPKEFLHTIILAIIGVEVALLIVKSLRKRSLLMKQK